ncbi:hypothetical protein ACEPPZ_18305 [Paracoccus yeei]
MRLEGQLTVSVGSTAALSGGRLRLWRRNRLSSSIHLERVEVVIEPEDLPEHAGRQKVLIGEDGEPVSATDGVDGSRSRHHNVPHWLLSE